MIRSAVKSAAVVAMLWGCGLVLGLLLGQSIWDTPPRPAAQTFKQQCAAATFRYEALKQCDVMPGCRLNDKEHLEFRNNGLLMVEKCAHAKLKELELTDGGETDKEVQPQPDAPVPTPDDVI